MHAVVDRNSRDNYMVDEEMKGGQSVQRLSKINWVFLKENENAAKGI
jgi:hypothetical protein